MPIQWVFFDIGDVLFDEDVPHMYFFHSILLAMRRNGVQVEWDDYHARIQACVREKPGSGMLDAARYYVSDEALWGRIYREGRAEYDEMRRPRPYGLLLDNITDVLRDLSRDFKLGVIANQ